MGPMAERIDWAHLTRLGLGALRLPPETFWAMTPSELRLALEGAGLIPVGTHLDRSWLSGLMAAYPDDDAARSCAAKGD